MAAFNKNITLTASTGSTVPALAQAAGFTQLVFADDFTDTSTLQTTVVSDVVAGKNWYQGSATTGTQTIQTTATAANVNNGNTGAGANASPHGGLMKIVATDGPSFNNGLATLPASYGDHQNTNTSAVGGFLRGYFETYMQWNPVNNPGGGSWPGWWGTPFYGAPATLPERIELDFMESGGTTWGMALHPWAAGNNGFAHPDSNVPRVNIDANWHTFSCLWTSSNITMYFDGNAITGGSFPTGSGTNYPTANLYPLQVLYACTIGAPLYIDWMRVWQPPGSVVVNTPHQFNPGT